MTKRIVVIMAGGRGERFWPLSHRRRPKQFLPLVASRSLLEGTLELAKTLPGVPEVWIVVGKEMLDKVRALLPQFPQENIIVEPVGRNSAPCLGLSAIIAKKRLGNTTGILAMPSDGLIRDQESFRERAESAFQIAEKDDLLVTFGVKPTRPETGYGYLELGDKYDAQAGAFRVKKFHEKPNTETAQRYVSSGKYLWNSGMFVFRADVFLRAIAEHAKTLAKGLAQLEQAMARSDFPAQVEKIFPRLPAESVDYAIMEKADNIATVVSDIDWDDIGNWDALFRLQEKDADGNIVIDRAVVVDSKNNLLVGEGVTIASLGVEDLIVIATPSAVLVTRRGEGHNIRKILAQIKKDPRLEDLL
jgi:mannose-1-phosphate guanylyltransferase